MTHSNDMNPVDTGRLERDEAARRSPWLLFAWIAGSVVSFLFLLLALDYFVLWGDVVMSEKGIQFDQGRGDTMQLSSSEPELEILVERAGVPYTLILSTYPQELALRWTVTSPEGWEVAKDSDFLRTKGHRITTFVPQTTGPHILRIERWASQPAAKRAGLLNPPLTDRVNVSVRVEDRSILLPLMRRRQPYRWLPRADP